MQTLSTTNGGNHFTTSSGVNVLQSCLNNSLENLNVLCTATGQTDSVDPLKNTQVGMPTSGKWTWNDEEDFLEFISAAEENKEKKKMTGINKFPTDNRRHSQGGAARGGRYGLTKPRTVGHAELTAYKDAVKQSQTQSVTIEHVKFVAMSLMLERDDMPIPLCFMTVIKSGVLDKFLATLLLYLLKLADRKAVEQHHTGLSENILLMESVRVREETEQANAKLELAKTHLAVCYSKLLLGSGSSPRPDDTWGRKRVSSLFRDKQTFECLYSFVCYVAWVAFGRKNLKEIQVEIGHLLYSEVFNPALRNQEKGEEPRTEKSDQVSEEQPAWIKRQRRPDLNKLVTKRSPLITYLLPTPQEKAPHLFQGTFPYTPQDIHTPKNIEELEEELSEYLASFRFGILGQPLKLFNKTTLMPLEPEKREEEGADEDLPSKNEYEISPLGARVNGSITGQFSRMGTSQKYSSYSRAQSKITMDAPSSDTE